MREGPHWQHWPPDDPPTQPDEDGYGWCAEHGRWECDHIDHDPKCQHGNLLDDGCAKCEATAEYLDELKSCETSVEQDSARGNNAGGGDVRAPALPPAPLQLDYPAWRLSFSAYAEHMGWEVPA